MVYRISGLICDFMGGDPTSMQRGVQAGSL